jgi:hypothetical protein
LSARAYDLGKKALHGGVDIDAVTARYNEAQSSKRSAKPLDN